MGPAEQQQFRLIILNMHDLNKIHLKPPWEPLNSFTELLVWYLLVACQFLPEHRNTEMSLFTTTDMQSGLLIGISVSQQQFHKIKDRAMPK